MKFESFKIEGPLLCTPSVFKDSRGFFFESWNSNKWLEGLNSFGCKDVEFVQDNHSHSLKGVLRGLHFQVEPFEQGKLVRCVYGEIYDVAVDIRPKSSTFGEWVGVYLDSANCQELWIPKGFAHGFLTVSETADVLYKATNYWNRDAEGSISWNDPELAIKWPLDKIGNLRPILSSKDEAAPKFSTIHSKIKI